MIDHAAANQDWIDWLSNADCLPWLREQAALILRQASLSGLPPGLWPYGRPEALSADQLESALDEIAHEFWIFMRVSLADRSQALPPELDQARQRPHLVATYFRNGFLLRLRSQARRKDVSLYHYLYRRIREVVWQGAGFFQRSGSWGTLYSLEPDGESLNTLQGLVEGEYADWPSPHDLVSESRLLGFHAVDLEELARHFWREVASRLGRACFLPCRELATYLGCHYQSLRVGLVGEESWDTGATGDESSLAEVQISGLAVLAEQLMAGWSDIRRRVFALALDSRDMTLREVAERSGLQGPSHVRYHLQKACEDLSNFCDAWPGVPPEPSNRKFWTEFLFCVAAACKNRLPGRSEEVK